MKKLSLLASFLLAFFVGVTAFAESLPITVNNEAVKAMLDSSLENGFSHHKDVKTMLDNALLNGYDYCNVISNEQGNIYIIKVAIEGFSSALSYLENSNSENDAETLVQTNELISSHCNTIYELFKTLGREDANFAFTILDDEHLSKYGDTQSAIVSIVFSGSEEVSRFSAIDAWK